MGRWKRRRLAWKRRRLAWPGGARISRPDMARLVDACEAYLSGRYAEYLDRLGRPIPLWALLNGVAHGTLGQVRALARGDPHPNASFQRPGYPSWRQVVALLATETAYAAGTSGALRRLQHEVLIPLELEVSCNPGKLPCGAVSLARMALHAIRQRGSQVRHG